ncbi:MAG: tetratricopeptide (TPR) repeat protein [Psychroserpens sp.]|jgi:tetratricopeptide (TPR) repeat protein
MTLNAQKTTIDSTKIFIGYIENPENNTELILSYNFFKNKKIELIKSGEDYDLFICLYYLADVQRKLGAIYDTEKTLIEALVLIDETKESILTQQNKISIYNHLGIVSRELLRFDNAINYYNNVLELSITSIDTAKVYGNIGRVYLELDNKEFAIIEYEKALNKAINSNVFGDNLIRDKELLIARLYDNLGDIKSKLELSGALEYLEKGLEIRKKYNYEQGIISSYINLSNHYYKNDKPMLYNRFTEEALRIADNSKSAKYKKAVITDMINHGYFSRSKEYVAIVDSMTITDKINSNKYSEAKYNYNKKEKELQESEFDKKRQKNIYIFFGILVLLGSVFIYFLIKTKHKKDKLQQVFNTESRISKKVHDEIANDVFQVMTKLQSTKSNDELIDDIEQIYIKTRDISKEHSLIDLEGDFQDILSDLILSFNDADTNVIAKGVSKVDWNLISDIKRITIFKVLQELLINMKKHSEAEIVVLAFETNRKTIGINCSDNGKGCDLKKGSGLQNVENRIASIKGTITFDSELNKGFKTKITI